MPDETPSTPATPAAAAAAPASAPAAPAPAEPAKVVSIPFEELTKLLTEREAATTLRLEQESQAPPPRPPR